MRINYFVGLEGTHNQIRKILEVDPSFEVFETFFGPEARQRVTEPLEDTLLWIFGNDRINSEELNIGITKTGGSGTMLSTLWEKSPAGSRIFFFKNASNEKSIEMHTAFLKLSATRQRVERLTGMSEEALTNNRDAFSDVCLEALTTLNSAADTYNASAWAPFDVTSFHTEAGVADSDMLFRLARKS